MAGNLKKVGGALLKVVSIIPDTAEIVGKTIQTSGSLIEKAMDQHHEKQQHLVPIPDVVDLDVIEARLHLENRGFVVTQVLAKPDKKWAKKHPSEVVKMEPKPTKAMAGSLVKIYYVSDSVLEASRKGSQLPNVVGLNLEEARPLLLGEGFKVAEVLVPVQRRYAKTRPGVVLYTEPRISSLGTSLKAGSLVKLFYADQETVMASQELLNEDHKREEAFRKKIGQTLNQVTQIFPKKKSEK